MSVSALGCGGYPSTGFDVTQVDEDRLREVIAEVDFESQLNGCVGMSLLELAKDDFCHVFNFVELCKNEQFELHSSPLGNSSNILARYDLIKYGSHHEAKVHDETRKAALKTDLNDLFRKAGQMTVVRDLLTECKHDIQTSSHPLFVERGWVKQDGTISEAVKALILSYVADVQALINQVNLTDKESLAELRLVVMENLRDIAKENFCHIFNFLALCEDQNFDLRASLLGDSSDTFELHGLTNYVRTVPEEARLIARRMDLGGLFRTAGQWGVVNELVQMSRNRLASHADSHSLFVERGWVKEDGAISDAVRDMVLPYAMRINVFIRLEEELEEQKRIAQAAAKKIFEEKKKTEEDKLAKQEVEQKKKARELEISRFWMKYSTVALTGFCTSASMQLATFHLPLSGAAKVYLFFSSVLPSLIATLVLFRAEKDKIRLVVSYALACIAGMHCELGKEAWVALTTVACVLIPLRVLLEAVFDPAKKENDTFLNVIRVISNVGISFLASSYITFKVLLPMYRPLFKPSD